MRVKINLDTTVAAGGGPRVLIVDDQPESVALMELVLRQHYSGARIHTCFDGTSALALAEREPLDVVLLDAKMPGLEGLEVCRRLKRSAATAHVPVLLVSGVYTQSADRVRGIEFGADGYLCKPFERAELVAQVEVLLRIKRAEDGLRAQIARQGNRLEQSESRFHKLFEQSPDALFVENEAGVVLDVNGAACRLHGMRRDELVGRSVFELVPEDERDAVRREYPKWFTGALTSVEGFTHTHDGRRIPVDIRASTIEYDGQRAVLLQVRDIGARRQAEEALRISENRYRAIVEDQTDFVCRSRPDTTITFVNAALEKLTGQPREKLIGGRYLDFVPADERPAMLAMIAGLSLARPTATMEHRVVRPDGTIVWHEWVNHGMFDESGKLVEIQAVGRDITQRIELEARQETMLRGMRAVVGIADELIAAPDEDSLLQLAVECARNELGLERVGILLDRAPWVQGSFGTDYEGRTTDERSKRLPMDQTWAEVLRLRKPGEPRWTVQEGSHVYWFGERMAGDRAGWVALTPIQTAHKSIGVLCNDTALTGTPLDPAKQEVAAVFCSLLANIAERKSAEAERSRLALAVDQSAESVLITDSKGHISYVNPGFERMTGYRRDEVIGKTPRILKSGKHGDAFYQRIWNTLNAGKVWTGRMTNRRRDGSLYEIEHTISPVRDPRGQVINYMSVAQDVTTAVQLENELRQAQKMESIGRLAGGIAHDFNNLLTAILGFSRMVANEIGPGSEIRGDVDEIISAAERAAKLTRQLLSFGRKQVIQMQPVDLNALVANMDRMLRRTLGEHIELVTELAPATGLIEADPGQVEQIIMNLAINAHDAMPKGGRLLISTSRSFLDDEFCRHHVNLRPGAFATLVVRDNGSGMPDHVRERAFEPFFTTKEKGKGSGLGLSTVYGIVKQTHGHIELASETGAGTVLTIHLPASTGEVVPRAAEVTTEVPTGTETILVVEDEQIVRRLAVRNLQSLGYTILEAGHGEQALEVLAANPGRIHLLLTDVIMPRLNGPDLVARVLETQPAFRHIYMTGFTEDMLTRNIQNAGAAPVILKPFTRETLARQIRIALDQPAIETGR